MLRTLANESGHQAEVCPDLAALAASMVEGAGAAILTEEALGMVGMLALSQAVASQPNWSDLPFIVMVASGDVDGRIRATAELMRPLRNVTVIERPVRPATIVVAIQVALRARQRQYALRDAWDELHLLNRDLEERVTERTEKLQLVVRELEGFTHSVAHDMRTPLRAMIGNASILLEDYGDEVPPGARDQLERISTAARKMSLLIEDLLHYARLGRREVRRDEIDMTALAQAVVDVVREESGETIEARIQPRMRAKGDLELVRMALHNLVGNAMKYRSKARPLTLDIGTENGAFYVRDNGIGFQMEYASRLFLPFERLHRDADYPGTGIGLANVKRIVERHSGQVWAEGRPGEGSTFRFTLT